MLIGQCGRRRGAVPDRPDPVGAVVPARLEGRRRDLAAADVIRPLLAAAVVFVLPVAPDTARTAILLAAVPSGFFGILFAVNYRLDSATAGSMVIASTVFSIVTMAIAIAMLFSALRQRAMTLAILCSGQGGSIRTCSP